MLLHDAGPTFPTKLRIIIHKILAFLAAFDLVAVGCSRLHGDQEALVVPPRDGKTVGPVAFASVIAIGADAADVFRKTLCGTVDSVFQTMPGLVAEDAEHDGYSLQIAHQHSACPGHPTGGTGGRLCLDFPRGPVARLFVGLNQSLLDSGMSRRTIAGFDGRQ